MQHSSDAVLLTGFTSSQNEILASIKDVTERKRMEIEFRLHNQAETAKFISNVNKILKDSHQDINRNITP